jgi:hypothetical protein
MENSTEDSHPGAVVLSARVVRCAPVAARLTDHRFFETPGNNNKNTGPGVSSQVPTLQRAELSVWIRHD